MYEILQKEMKNVEGMSSDGNILSFEKVAEKTDLSVDELIEGAVYYQFEKDEAGSYATATDSEKDTMRSDVNENFFKNYDMESSLSPEMTLVNCAYKANGKFDEIQGKLDIIDNNVKSLNMEYYSTGSNEYFEDASSLNYALEGYMIRAKDPVDDGIVIQFEQIYGEPIQEFIDELEAELGM